MKILMVCQHYYPERFQNQDICEQMVQDGHEVTVLTGLPNYETGYVLDEYKTGKHNDEKINGVQVYRTFEIGRRKGVFWRMLNYFSYMFSASWWALWNRRKYDIVFSYQLSPVLMMLPAVITAKKQHIPLFVYCCDLWPESMKAMPPGDKWFIFKPIHWISRWLYHRANAISVQSKSFFEYFESVNGIAREKMSYIPHMASSAYLDMDFSQDNGIIDFVFLGNIGNAQDVPLILDAAERNKELSGFALHFVGDGIFLEKAKQLVQEKGLEKIVIFHGRQPVEKMPDYYKLADVCLVTLKPGSTISKTIPSKVQGYMAAGDLDAFAAHMKDFILHYGNYTECCGKARAYFKAHFTKRMVVDAVEKRLEELVKNQGDKS